MKERAYAVTLSAKSKSQNFVYGVISIVEKICKEIFPRY
jgi:hypothetical protein